MALGLMQAELPGDGTPRSLRVGGEVRFGCREVAASSGAGAKSLCVDRAAGVWLAADARLDDRDALCDALGVAATERGTLADAELILRAWLRWGEDCPRHLLGDYAFALWDVRRRTLFCARDHIGARPFYYALPGEGIVFASAVEAVLAAPGVSQALDEGVVASHLARGPIDDSRTFFAAVRKLPPGHALCAEWTPQGSRRTRIARYWRPEQTPLAVPASDDAYAEQLRHLYAQAVRDRLRGCEAGTVGAHLSGGLDSSSIAVYAARELRRQGQPPPLAFDWLPALEDAPPKPEHAREYALVDAVCAQEGLQVVHGALSAADVVDVLRRDGALPGVHIHVNEEIVQRHAAARGVRVLLSGWGGDECVSSNGLGHWQHLLLSGRWRQLAAECRDQEDAAVRFLARIALPLVHPRLLVTLMRLRDGLPVRRRWLIDPAFARRAKLPAASAWRAIGVRRTALGLLEAGHLVDRIEGWAASGARRGIEYRYPLLDRRLLEFALGLPPEQFRRGRWGRWLFRHAHTRMLPAEVCWNRIKSDPARSEPLRDAIGEALPAIRQRLAAHPPTRASYVDMRRLREHLGAERFRSQPEGPLMRALWFLDF